MRERAVRAGQGTEHGIGDPSTTSAIRGPPTARDDPRLAIGLCSCVRIGVLHGKLFKFHTLLLVFVLIFMRNRRLCSVSLVNGSPKAKGRIHRKCSNYVQPLPDTFLAQSLVSTAIYWQKGIATFMASSHLQCSIQCQTQKLAVTLHF